MIESIPKLIITIGGLLKVGIEKIELKKALDKAVNLLNWCYKEIKRLNQIVFSLNERNKALEKELAKYKDKA